MTTKKHDDEPEVEAKATEVPPPMPFSASINEPQTLSTPLPEGTKVPVPVITSIDPEECTIGDDDFTLDIVGENFFGDSVIFFAGQPEPTSFDGTDTLSTGVNMAVWHGPDVVKVQVSNGPEKSNEVDFTFNAPVTRKGKK